MHKMCKLRQAAFLIIGFACISAQAQAGEWFFGGKLAYFEIDKKAVDEPDNAGLVVSYDWNHDYGSYGVEGDFTTSFKNGENASGDIDLDTVGIYGVFRTKGLATKKGAGPYLKLKAGAAYLDLTVADESEDELNASIGIGLGLNLISTSLELEYTLIDKDIDMISLHIRF